MSYSNYEKLCTALKFRLIGLGYYVALDAYETAKAIHVNKRKDGVTPEFQHQIEIALYILTLKDVKNLETVIVCALLHDTIEDYPSHKNHIEQKFGNDILQTLLYLDKNLWNVQERVYFDQLAKSQVGSIVKLADRIHNFQTMNRGKFTQAKQQTYAKEVETLFLPMAKQARRNFPEQTDAYYNMEIMLKNQLEFVKLLVSE